MKRVLMATAIAISAWPAAAADGGPMVRASCTEKGRIVYREEFPADAPAEKRIVIAAKHPGAMCVFLNVDHGGSNAASHGNRDVLPADLLAAAAGQTGDADAELAAALSVIASGKPGDPYPSSIASAFAATAPKNSPPTALKSSGKAGPASSSYLSLTVGIYRDMPLPDVMAHWKIMQEGTKVLSRMTPTVNTVDGVTVVSVEGVPDHLAADLCDEAARTGAGCLAAF